MTALSPAAQAVMDKAFVAYDDEILYVATGDQHAGKIAAAALRTAVEQVLPETTEPKRTINIEPERDVAFIGAWHIWNKENSLRAKLLAIATELETHQ